MDEQKNRIDNRSFSLIVAGLLTGGALIFTYGTKIHYPALKEQSAIVQKISSLEDKLRHDREAMSNHDPNTIVGAAQEYAKDETEHGTLMQNPEAQKAWKEYDHSQCNYLMKLAGLGFGPVYTAAGIGIFWQRRQYKRYGLNKKVLKQ